MTLKHARQIKERGVPMKNIRSAKVALLWTVGTVLTLFAALAWKGPLWMPLVYGFVAAISWVAVAVAASSTDES